MTDLDFRDVTYKFKTLRPGQSAKGLRDTYPLLVDDHRDMVEEWEAGQAPGLLIRGGSFKERTCVAIYATGEGSFRYWQEGTYVRNLQKLDELKILAQRRANDPDVLDHYFSYEEDLATLASSDVLVIDDVGAGNFWPNEGVESLISMILTRLQSGLITIVSVDEESFKRVPYWSKVSQSDACGVIDLAEQ